MRLDYVFSLNQGIARIVSEDPTLHKYLVSCKISLYKGLNAYSAILGINFTI